MNLLREREQLTEYGKRMSRDGLSVGTSGNLSIYVPEAGLMAITPSGLDYEATTPADIVAMDLLGQGHLPAGGQFFQHDGVQPCPRRVQSGSVAARAAAHHEHIVNMVVVHI